MDHDAFLRWIDGYERAWRTQGTAALAELFAEDATYLPSPYGEPVAGLPAICTFWDAERDGPDEVFAMTRSVVSASGDTGVARVEVRYGDPVRQEYRDLWVVEFAPDGRAARFEEWPFWPAHGRGPLRPEPVVLDALSSLASPYHEWVRSAALSGGVYALSAGAVDGQQPHTEDEVYVVVQGSATLEVAGRSYSVRPGSTAYVPAGVGHRFTDITDDLRVVVLFAPPEADEA